MIRPQPPRSIILSHPKRQIIHSPIPLHIQIHNHPILLFNPHQIPAIIIHQRPRLRVEMPARTEQHIAIVTARIPAQDVHLGGREVEGVKGGCWVGAEEAEFVEEAVPREGGGGEDESEKDG